MGTLLKVELIHQAIGSNTRNTARTRGSLVAKLAWFFLLFGIILFVLNQPHFAWQEQNSLNTPFPTVHSGIMENICALRIC